MAVCSHLLLGCQTLDKSVKLKPWNVADFSRTWSGLTADFFLKYYDKMGCVRSRLLKKSQRKHFAPNASLLAALVRLDGKELLAESSLCSNRASTPGSPAGRLGTPGGSNKPYLNSAAKGRELHPANPLYFKECFLWHLCATGSALVLWKWGWKLLAKFASINSLASVSVNEGNEKSDTF